ncbi:titin homolog isoform X2 [Harpegnathos saltator]|uniref:titin homolog isoform X2 n=1 Tax=Harpegnathos saltator TaxID=610380 RepID=UPI000DBEDF66|nr:titin homolog isoform X2 [Harpegnathos saltator]XP_025160957.1 titin homolog isoform X2 [Harpegnathos saltator]XP_025160959.1 titin homolog isoform X2 [Harpegnathos saltator]
MLTVKRPSASSSARSNVMGSDCCKCTNGKKNAITGSSSEGSEYRIRDGLPISSERYRLSMRGNVVQLALKQSQKNDAGYYSLVATRLGQDKGASKKIHMSIDETSYEEGEPPIFLRRLSDLAVKVGTRTRFLVEIRSATTLKITWYKNDAVIHEGPRFSLVHEGNFHCVDVVPVTVEDQGRWTCMAENRSGRSSCTSTLTVVVPKAYKKPEFIEELRALLTETGTVSLECKVVGVPTPVLRWFKDNKEIKAGDVFALTANPDDPTSLGVYTCEAVNCMGTAYSSSKVHVVGRGSREGSLKPADALTPSGPLPVFKQILQDECCRIGDTLVLSCRVQVPPWPRAISWYNKGGRVESSEKYHVMEDGIGGYSIEVKQVEAVDEGEWKCVATSEENMKQITSCYVAMSIPRNYRKPRFMENLKAVLTEEGLVSFECKVVGFPTPLLSWFKDGQELKPGDVYQLTGTNSLGSYCCIARNCMGEAKSTAELTIEDIQNQLNEEERFQLLSSNQPPKFIKGLRSCEARINEDFQFIVQVSVAPEPNLSWYRDDALVDENDKYHLAKETLGTCHLEVRKLEFIDQAEWKCVAANDFGHSVTSCFLKLIIPKHYKRPKFLESLRAILSEEGAVNLECKVIGVPQPILKWYKDNVELKPGDIHRIISGQDGTCCLGTYTCEATNCMGTVSSSASLLGFEDKKTTKEVQSPNGHELARNLSLSTIHEERTSQLYDTPQTDHSVTLDERGEVSFSFDGKEVSVSLYETPDLTEEEALQIVEMYADQLSEHVTEHNVIELPPMRFVKETSTSGNLLMEAVVIDVSPDYFVSAEDGDDLRTEADFEDVSIMDDPTNVLSSPERDSRSSLKRSSARYNGEEDEKAPTRPPRKKSASVSSSRSEKSQRFESESFHSAQKDEPPLSPLSSIKQDDSDTFADALSSAHLSVTESPIQRQMENSAADNRKRSLSAERTAGSSLDDGIGGDSSFDSVTGAPKKKKKKKQRRKKQRHDRSNSEEYSGPSDYEAEKEKGELEGGVDTKRQHPTIESLDKIETDIGSSVEQKTVKKCSTTEEGLLDNSKSARKAASVFADQHPVGPQEIIGAKEEALEAREDILLEPRMALHQALQTYEKISDVNLPPRLSNIRQRVEDMYRRLEIPRGRSACIELLIDLEAPLRALLKTIGEIKLAEDVEIVHNILEPSVVQLSHVVANLQLSSLQPTLVVLRKINDSICSIPNGTEGSSSSARSISDESRNISREIVDPLINVQAAFSMILDRMEQSAHGGTANGAASPQQVPSTTGFAACLIELRECVSHAAHTAMTLKENETLNSLTEFAEPLLDLQLALASEEYTPRELPMIKETTVAIESLRNVIATVAKRSGRPEAISRVGTILKALDDTGKQMSKLAERLSEAKDARGHALKNLNVDQSLSGVHFALSSVLEKQDKQTASSHLINCIETLRQAVGSSAVTIASLKNPTDDEITREISRLNKSLSDLQRNLLTDKHDPGEEAILCNLMTPIGTLREIFHSVIESGSSIESIAPLLELLEEIRKDAPLIAKEISKKKERDALKSERSAEKRGAKSALAGQISRSLDPIKNWLSTTSEDSTKDEMESALSSTIEELKRDVSKIAIQTSYSEPPSDKSLIEALIDLREPLTRLQTAISVYHEPEDLSTLEGLGRPMKHLLQIIMDVLREHQEEESLRPIVNIVEQIENQISFSIKEALYQQELRQSDKTFAAETEEEVVTASRETIPGTLTEIPSTPFEASSTTLPTEQTATEDGSKKSADDVAQQIAKDERHEREENASKLIMLLSETLEKLQLEMTGVLEDFEESSARTTTIPQSKLANSLEELRRTVSTIRVMTTVYGEEIGSFEEKVNQAALVLTNLLQPLTNIRTVLSRTHEHDVLELMILNRLSPLLNTMEDHVIRQTTEFIGKGEETEKEFETLLCVLGEIKEEVPVVVQKISSRRKILEHLRDITKPLESILERMSDLEKAAEDTLETDVAKILGKPTALLLGIIKTAAQESDVLEQREPVVLELHNLVEPLLEFHTCLSMVQSSRRSLVPEAALLEERRSVILRAVDGLRKQVCDTVEAIASTSGASLFDETLTLLNSAILQVQKQIGKTDYSRRSSSTKIPLQHRLTGTLNRLASTITALEEHTDEDTHEIVAKCLEALQKQISLAQTQFIQTESQLIDEEAIVEGFLYPTNQLLSALNVIKENAQQRVVSATRPNLADQLRQLAGSISEMSSSLLAHKTELVREGASKGAPIVETFTAVIDVLDHVKDIIVAIEEIAEAERKASVMITKVESVTDEIVEVFGQKEIESVMTVTEIPPAEAVVEETAQLKIQDTLPATQTAASEDRESLIRVEQAEGARRSEEGEKEDERQRRLYQDQMSKFNCSIENLQQPLRGLVDFVKSAMQGSLASKTEEDKRKVRELTGLIQNLYDLQATSTSVKAASSSSSITPLDSQFRRMEEIFVDFERAVDIVISQTHGEVRPELKENIMASLQSFVEPLSALESALVSVCATIDEGKFSDKDGEPLTAIPEALVSCLKDILKALSELQTLKKSVGISGEKEAETKTKGETKDIEVTTARPLEELIEAIMDSQGQVKGDKTSPFESTSPSTDPIESKDIEDLNSMEVEVRSSKAVVREADSSVTQVAATSATTDATETSQQTSASSAAPSQIEELPVEERALTPKSLAESLEEVKELKLPALIAQQTAELNSQSPDSSIGQVKVETLRAIICPLQEVCKTIDEIEEMAVPELPEQRAVAFSTLVEPLLKLELTLNRETQQTLSISSEGIEEIEQDSITSHKLSITTVLEELQKSIATVQEQVQLSTLAEGSSIETPTARLMQAVEQPLEDLKMSIACIQSEAMTCQQESELSSAEYVTVLQTVAKTAEEFGDRCMSIIGQLKIESVSPSQIVEQKDQKLDPELLHKIVDPIHVLRETLSQIEDLQDRDKSELSEIPGKKREAVQLNAVMHPLEKLEQSLVASMQGIIVVQEHVAQELGENRVTLESASLKPVLEELKNSITLVQQQAAVGENVLVVKAINDALESLKLPLASVEEIVDHLNEATGMETISGLLTFAKSVEETTNRLITVTAGQQIQAQQEIRESPLLKTLTVPIEGLQSAILRLEDRMCQTLETEKPTEALALERMLQPLQQLQRTFLTAPHEETALFLQQLPIKSTLDDLGRFVAVIQDQVMSVQDQLLPEANADDMAVLKDFVRSLGDLRTSTVVLQQLHAIENAGRQIIEIENASALQAFAKSIEEFRKCCSVVVERPRIVESFATIATEPGQLAKVDTQLLENIIAPLRILQEQILTIEETKMQQSEDYVMEERKQPVTVLSSLVGPLQQLEKSFVATVQEHVIEAHNEANRLTPELSSESMEKFALQPILEEVQKSIATVQEHVILEAGSHVEASEAETIALLRSIAQPLVDLRASIASVQQVAAIAPDSLNELGQQQNISTLEIFAETLHNLAECIAMCNHQQIVMEPAADTISEDVSSLNTWADVIEEPISRVTRPVVIDQRTVESPASIAASISEDEASMLKTLAKPLTELRECLALIVEERKVIAPNENTSSLTENENISLLKTMIQPLLELKDAATLAIQEQTAIERASEHSFAIEGKSEFTLHPLVEPLEELRHSIAVIQDQVLVETPTDRPGEDAMLKALAEPLFNLQRAISVLEARVMSPDVESMPDDTSNWISECLATPLHEIERSLADIRQCTVMEAAKILVEEKGRMLMPDWSIVEKLLKPMTSIGSVMSHIEGDSVKTEAIKTMAGALASVQENLILLKNRSNLSTAGDENNTDAIVESLSNLEKCISFIERKITDKSSPEQLGTMEVDIAISSALSSPLSELKRSIVTVEESPSEYLKKLERPLELVQNALETVVSAQRHEKLSILSAKLQSSISDINDSIGTIGRRLEEQQVPVVVEVSIEYEALGMLAKPLQNIKQCIAQIPEEPNTANVMIDALQNFGKSISLIREQSADKPLAESQDTHYAAIGLSKNLVPCLLEMQESIEITKTLWQEKTALEGLMILEEPVCKLQTLINITRDQFIAEEIIWKMDKEQIMLKKKIAKKEKEPSEEEQKKFEKGEDKEKQKMERKDEKSMKEESEQQKIGKIERSEEKEEQKVEEPEKTDRPEKEVDKVQKEEDEQREKKEIVKAKDTKEAEEGVKKKEIEQKKEKIMEDAEENKSEKGRDEKEKKVKELEKEEMESIKKEETAQIKIEVEKPKTEEEAEKIKKDDIIEKENQEAKSKDEVTKKKKEEFIKEEADAEVKVREEEVKKKEQMEKLKEEDVIKKSKERKDEEAKSEKIEGMEEKKEVPGGKEETSQVKMKEEQKMDEVEKPKKDEAMKKSKEEDEKAKNEKIGELKREREEFSKKEEVIQLKVKEEEQKEAESKITKKDEAMEKLKEEKDEKAKSKKIEELEEKKEEISIKQEEAAEAKTKEVEQKKRDEAVKPKENEAMEKSKEEKDETAKSGKIENLEKKKEKPKKKEAAQMKMKEEQKKDEVEKPKKKDEAMKESKEEKDEKAKSEQSEEMEKKREESEKKEEEAAQAKMKEEEQKKDEVERPKKDEAIKESKEEKDEKTKSEKIEEMERKKEESDTKEEAVQVKIKEEEQKNVEAEKPKKDEAIEKSKGEKDEKTKNEKTEKLEKKKEKPKKKEETAQVRMREKEQKKKDEAEKPKKDEALGKSKEEKDEEAKSEKIKELEKEKEKTGKKEETAQMKIKEEEEEKGKDEGEKPKKDEAIEKSKEEKVGKAKSEVMEEMGKIKKESSKKDEAAQMEIKREEQEKKDETEKSRKEDEKLKPTAIEEAKVIPDEQIKVTDTQENKKAPMQRRSKRESKKAEKADEEPIEKRKEEIRKMDEKTAQTQSVHVNDAMKENEASKDDRQYRKSNEDWERDERLRMRQKQEEKFSGKISELQERENKSLYLKINKEINETGKEEERRWPQDIRSDESRIWKERKDRSRRNDDERLDQVEIERPERKRDVSRFKKDETNYLSGAKEERPQRWSDEKWLRKEENARLLREEEQRLRRRREEEISRNKQRREEQIREIEWSKKRQSESDRFLRDLLETRYRPEKSTSMFLDGDYFRDKWEHTSRFDSRVSMTSFSMPRSYSWRDSLTSLNRRRIDDYWDYKLRNFSANKYYIDTGSSYRRRRRRENRMIRARSTSLLKYEDYSTGDSDATLVPSTRIRLTRRAKTETLPRISLDSHDSGCSSYVGLSQNESPPIWDKPKKPSFCTRLTNRIVGVGMRTRLTCTVLGNPEPRVHWTKDGEKLDTSSSRCKTRYENGMAYLELHDVLPEDTGLYMCVAENIHGTTISESTLKVYYDYKPTYSPPTFVRSIKDIYRYSDHKLVLECRVQGYPAPTVSWLKDGEILQGPRYRQAYLDNDVYHLEIAGPGNSDNGRYTCRAVNELRTEEISHVIHLQDRERQPASRSDRTSLSNETDLEVPRRPRFSNLLKDYNVPTGGTIALQVEVKGEPAPEVRWFRGDRKEPIAIPKARIFVERGLHTLIVPEATESEKGTYFCRAINAYGQVDTSATVDVISASAIDGGKPAVFVSRPARKTIDVIVGEDVSVSFRANGVPKPRVTWMKGLTDITDGPRSYKESIDDYVRLTLKRALPSDEGTYCILVKNRYGCDRCFFSIKVKQRARSLTPSPDWSSVTERDVEEADDMSYVRNAPGPISSEPVVVDGGKNWLSLTWGKAERRGPAPVIAYKVEAWLLGGDGGARWVELGITPINAFDAFNLRPAGEYKFRVTPRNRYGWGEPVTMANSVYVSESTDLPEFTKILPGQLKALEGTPVRLECAIRGDPKMEVRWYRETTELDSRNDSRFKIHYDTSECSLTIANVKEDDSGRYVCEASNRIGKVSSFARVLVVTDPRIIEADAKLRTSLSIEPEDRPPQFTMRIRDRRVQTTYPVRLTCQVIGQPAPEITWYKNEVEISQDDRHIFWDDDSNFHTLEIIHSTLEDSGCYMATARNINGSVSCRCVLVVDKGIRAYIAPEFLRDLDAAYTIHPGRELRMSAQVEAYPSVGVVWHRDGIRLRPSRRATMTLSHDGSIQFSLANITDRDAGIYSCTATNAVGHAETTARVAVVTATGHDQSSVDESSDIISATPADIPYSKEPLFVTKPLSTEAVEGDTVIILCEVVGDPKPEVIWLRDFLKPDYYRDAPHFRLVGAGPQYRLEIPYAKLDFTGTYSVIARNCHGEAKAVISLQIYARGQGKEDRAQKSRHGKVLSLPIVKRELRDLRCCDGDAVSLECKVYATPEPPLVRWERGGKIITMVGDFNGEFDGETARLNIQHVYPEDEGEYTCVAYNDLGKAYTSACLVVDVPEGKENILSQRLTRPIGLLSAGSTPRSTPRSTPIRSLSPAVSHGREFRSPQMLARRGTSRRPKVCPPKFYAVPHNRLVQEGETVRFQCAVVGHPAPWVRWDKNGTIVTPSARVSIKERDDVKILEIVDVMREDAALYRITAENDFGRIEASARLEVISRYESTSRTIRTRSASPRTYPTFDRSLLPTTGRINGRLQLECRMRGTPSVTPTWYRNGRPLERSSRIKRYFDGATAKIEISKVKASDAGEYTCVATNVLGSTRNSCQVTVLHHHDSSTADKNAPRFLQPLPEESIVMENHPHEFQTGVTGTPPFTVTWSRDGRELPDNDYCKYVIYGDGGVALRLSQVRPQDAGEYTCVVRNHFGVASCSSLFAVQDYKDLPKLAPPQFTKTPLSVIAAKGSTACFCARVQCGKATDVAWSVNGRDARENAKCKIERDGSVSILRIRDVTSREAGEIRCTASFAGGKGPSIGCVAKLRLRHSSNNLGDPAIRPEGSQSYTKLSPSNTACLTGTPERIASTLKRGQRCEESPMRVRSSSFPRRSVSSCAQHASPLPARRRAANNVPMNTSRKSRLDGGVVARRTAKQNVEEDAVDNPAESSPSTETEQPRHQNDQGTGSYMKSRPTDSQPEPPGEPDESNDREETICRGEENAETEQPMRAAIVKEPSDVTVFKGNRAVLRVTYQGRPEPTVKWLRVNRQLLPGEKVDIVSGDGESLLTLDDVTYDHAGKYEVSVENSAGKERSFFSLAVEGPPEPPADRVSVNLSAGQATIVWRSPAYDGGRTVIGYTVEAKRAVNENTWMVIAESCHSLSQTVPTAQTDFVVPGESYRFRVRAENVHGLSDPGVESDLVRIPKPGETMLQEEEEDNFEPSFEPRVVEPKEGRLFDEGYDVHEELGKGRYGIVKKVTERATGMCFAAKFVRTIKAKDREQVREEIRIMNALRHPKLLLLAAAYESPRETVMITEYISGGELFERVVADDFTLTERDSILFMRQICEGVEYMHQNKIVHLDLKPENVMCRTRTSHQIKLIDFGLAQTLKPDTPIRVLFGTPEFIPPEIISYEPIGTESDMWSVGVICYVLLTGLSPFMGDNDAETFANITRADYDLEDEAFDAISNDAKDFISGLLIKRKELRMSAAQCLEHPWMAQRNAAMSRVVLPTDKLKKFIVRRKWQKTGNAIRALGRMAMLSAYNRRSPATTAESSPTLEKQFDSLEISYPSDINVTQDNPVGAESQENMHSFPSSSPCMTGRNMKTQGIMADNIVRRKFVPEVSLEGETTRADDSIWTIDHEKEFQDINLLTTEVSSARQASSSDCPSEQINIEGEMSEPDVELTSKQNILRDATTHHPQLMSEKNKEENGKELIEKSVEIEKHSVPRSQALCRVLRGDSRDSGIGDCNSNQMTSPLQVDELGIVSTIKEEADHESQSREGKRTSRKEDAVKNRRSSTSGILTTLARSKESPFCDMGSSRGDDKVATKTGVTKASCEINLDRKVADENTDARLLIERTRDKFLPTGNVSRTARIFERESATSKSDDSQVSAAQRAYPAALVAGKPYNERIQKAFAFWNK